MTGKMPVPPAILQCRMFMRLSWIPVSAFARTSFHENHEGIASGYALAMTIVGNVIFSMANSYQPIPRHREIKDHLARHILRKLKD